MFFFGAFCNKNKWSTSRVGTGLRLKKRLGRACVLIGEEQKGFELNSFVGLLVGVSKPLTGPGRA